MRKILCSFIVIVCYSCTSSVSSDTEKYQKVRNNIVNVQGLVKEILSGDDDALIGSFAQPYIMGDYLLILDYRSLEKCVHIYNKANFQYITSVVNKGEGPNEITTVGELGIDEKRNKFYVTDHGKLKIFSYDLDSVLADSLYTPSVKLTFKSQQFPAGYEYIDDTLCIARLIVPISSNDYKPHVARWNMIKNEFVCISHERKDIEHKRITFASDAKYGLFIELYNNYDLISVGDFDGKLKCNIYGPGWDSGDKKSYYSGAVFCNNKIIVSCIDADYNIDQSNPTKLIVFDINGDYIKTLDVRYKINRMCYDEDMNRLIMNFDDVIQFGYLDLESLI